MDIPEINVQFYKYDIVYGEWESYNDDKKYVEHRVQGLTAAKDFVEACAKLVDYYGNNNIISMYIFCELNCDVIEMDTIHSLFPKDSDEEDIFEEDAE